MGAVTPLGVGAETLTRAGRPAMRDPRGRRRVHRLRAERDLTVKEIRRARPVLSARPRRRRRGGRRGRLGRRAPVRPDACRLHRRHRDRRDPDDRDSSTTCCAIAALRDVSPLGYPGVDAERGRRGGVDEARAQGPDVQRRVRLLERRPRDRLRAADDPVRRRRSGRRRRRGGDADAVRIRAASTRCRRCRRPGSRGRSTLVATAS